MKPGLAQIVKAAGTRLAIEQSLQHQDGRSTDIGSSRQQHQLKADPNEVRRLQAGMCFVLGSGKAQKLQIAAVASAATDDVFRPSQPRDEGSPELPPDDDEPLRL